MIRVPEDVQVGNSIRFYWNRGNPNNYLAHIRAIVDGEWIVARIWSRREWWVYRIDNIYWYEVCSKICTLIDTGEECNCITLDIEGQDRSCPTCREAAREAYTDPENPDELPF